MQWTNGYTESQLDHIQDKYDLVFPPDLKGLFSEKRPAKGYDWFDEAVIRQILSWPFEGLVFDIEYNELWWPEWGNRPESSFDRKEILRQVISKVPKLIPIQGHRFLPETPSEPDNPVFSVYGADTICYGANLDDYFVRDIEGWSATPWPTTIKQVPFWSTLVERNV
jgi:hypothetical protein